MDFKITLKKELFNKIYLPYLEDYSKFLMIFYGGGSSGKSKFIAQRNIFNLLKGGRNYLILKKTATSSQNSTFAEYKKVIDEWNLNKYFKITENPLVIKCTINGFKMLFQGMDDVEKKKSITFDRGILTDIHYEEATEETNPDVLLQLETRLRGNWKYKGKEVPKQIILSFNPILESHWIKKKYFDKPHNNVEILKTTYKDNRFLTKQDIERIESWKESNPHHHKVYGLGEWGTLGELVFHNWTVDDLSEIKDSLSNYNVGLDFGFTNDPTVLVLTAFHNNKIYILKEFYQKGMLNSDIAKVIKKDFNGYYIWADCAEPKSIKELQLSGCKVLPVKKGKDSVIHGIEWAKQFQIIVDESCTHMIEELQGYTWMKDKEGNVLNQPIDVNNHCFIKNTKVLMANGKKKNIQDIKVNDYVITRYGYNKVLKIWNNGIKEVNKYKINNNKIIGTDTHNIITTVKKKYIKDLTQYDILYIFRPEVNTWLKIKLLLKLLSLKELNLNVIQILKMLQIKNTIIVIVTIILKVLGLYTEKYGKTKMERYQKVMTFIIKMGILLIMIFQILKLFLTKNIYLIMLKNILKIIKNGLKIFKKKELKKQKNGISQKKDINGILNMLKINPLVTLNSVLKFVRYVIKNLKQILNIKSFVLTTANQDIEDFLKKIISQNNVYGVEKILLQTNIQMLSIVQELVQIKQCGKEEKKQVYNLTIEDHHEYFANNILVSNCQDSRRYAQERLMLSSKMIKGLSANDLGI